MRNFLTTTKCGLSAVAAVGRRTWLAAMLATTLTASSGQFATAQSPYQMGTSALTLADHPVENSADNYGLVSRARSIKDSEPLVSGVQRASHNTNVPAAVASVPQYSEPNNGYFDTGMSTGVPCPPGPGCDVSWYVNYEALWLRRGGDDNYTLSRFNKLPTWDYDLGLYGGRVTAGRLFDCTNGVEGVITGPFKWTRSSNVVGNGTLQSNLFPSVDYTLADINTFNNADQHVQTYQAKFSSYELNRTWWTWDVLQTLVGLRYINYEEDYALSSARAGVGNGLLQAAVNNNAIGPQIGGQLLRPASLRANYGINGKAAVLANFDDVNVFMSNNGSTLINSKDSGVDISGLVQMGLFGNYQVVPSVRLTAGYEFMYLPRFATIPGQTLTTVNLNTGSSIDNKSDVFLHGGSVGVQILY